MLLLKKKLLFAFIITIISVVGFAQPPAKPAAVKAPVAKPIKLTVKFGPYSDSSKAFAPDVKLAVKVATLKITDNNGGTWTVISYRLGWRKKDTNDDYKTGKSKTVYIFNATEVNNDPKVPEGWQKELQASLQPTEQLLFEEILVQDAKTKKTIKAPPLRIFIQ